MRIFLISLLCAATLSIAQGQPSKPTLNVEDIHGRPIDLSDFKGNVVLVNFWATWCQTCRAEIPDLIKWQKEYKRAGLQIIGVAYPPETTAEVRDFARQMGMTYPVALGTKETKTIFTSSETLPLTVVIDRQGAVRDVIEGIMYADEFEQKVKPLLSAEGVNHSPAKLRQRKHAKEQTATIVVGTDGYQPARVRLQTGRPARLTFMRNTDQTCGTQIVIRAYRINRPLPLNTPVVVRFTPRKSGRYKFTCGMDMFRGSVVVK